MLKNTFPSSPTVMIAKLASGNFACEYEAAVSTTNVSGWRAVAVRTKDVRSRKDTSHIAVMSIDVLALLTFALPISISSLLYEQISSSILMMIALSTFHKKSQNIFYNHQRRSYLWFAAYVCTIEKPASSIE